ncbi:MAG: hypothetical protein IT432_07880 [Phycisphaerales bacterium]|nr:hypothetical protein [Phycisphaerales bacterium]
MDPKQQRSDERVTQFLEQLDRLHRQAIEVSGRQVIWRELEIAAEQHPWIREPGLFYSFVRNGHYSMLAMWCRRCIDKDDDALSLVKLLRRVQNREVDIRRDRYVRLMASKVPELESYAQCAFDAWAGSGVERYPEDRVEADIEAVIRDARPVANWVDQHLAHLQKKPSTHKLQIKTIEAAIKSIMETQKKFHTMLTATEYLIDEPMTPPNWKASLSLPWFNIDKLDGLCTPMHPREKGPPYRLNRRQGLECPWKSP